MRSHSQAFSHSDSMEGVYEPPSVITRNEGGDKAGQVAALNYIQECIARNLRGESMNGRPWLEMNTFTRRVEFLYYKKKYSEKFKAEYRVDFEEATTDAEKPAATSKVQAVKDDLENAKAKRPTKDDEQKKTMWSNRLGIRART